MNAGPERPWLQRPEWEGGVVRLRRRHGLVAHWFGAVVWNVLSVPLLVGTWRRPSELAALPVPGRLVIAAWVLFGLFLATRAVVVTLRARRFRDSVLELDPFPVAWDGQMGGSVTIPARVGGEAGARVSLHCIHTQRRVKNGKTRRKREVLWSTEVVPEVRQAGGGSRLRFVFDVPGDLRGSGTERVGMYTFVGRLRDDGTILLGDGIRGSYLAGEVGRVLERETGLVVSSGPRT